MLLSYNKEIINIVEYENCGSSQCVSKLKLNCYNLYHYCRDIKVNSNLLKNDKPYRKLISFSCVI